MSRYRVRCYRGRGRKKEEEEGEDNESETRAYLVTAPSARSGPTTSGGDRGREKMGNHGRPHIAGGGCLSTV